MFSQLDAVNVMLAQSGQSTVTSLSADASADTTVAQTILDQATLDAQLRGLANNYYKVRTATRCSDQGNHVAC